MNAIHYYQYLNANTSDELSDDELSRVTGGFTYPQAAQFQNLLQQASDVANSVSQAASNAWEGVRIPIAATLTGLAQVAPHPWVKAAATAGAVLITAK